MIKPIGSKVFDQRVQQNELAHDYPNSNKSNHVHVSKPYLQWLVDQDESEYKRYIRRLSKLDIIDVIYLN